MRIAEVGSGMLRPCCVLLAEESNILLDRLEDFDYSSKTRKELHVQKYRQ